MLTREQADACLDVQSERICLIGHSHVALFFTRLDGERGNVRSAQAADGAMIDVSGGSWLVNPGSVGQPRDGDPRAAWLALDTEAATVPIHAFRTRSRRRLRRSSPPIFRSTSPTASSWATERLRCREI